MLVIVGICLLSRYSISPLTSVVERFNRISLPNSRSLPLISQPFRFFFIYFQALISYAETSPKGNVLLKDKGNCPSCDNTLDVSHFHAKDMVTEETTGPCSGCTWKPTLFWIFSLKIRAAKDSFGFLSYHVDMCWAACSIASWRGPFWGSEKKCKEFSFD